MPGARARRGATTDVGPLAAARGDMAIAGIETAAARRSCSSPSSAASCSAIVVAILDRLARRAARDPHRPVRHEVHHQPGGCSEGAAHLRRPAAGQPRRPLVRAPVRAQLRRRARRLRRRRRRAVEERVPARDRRRAARRPDRRGAPRHGASGWRTATSSRSRSSRSSSAKPARTPPTCSTRSSDNVRARLELRRLIADADRPGADGPLDRLAAPDPPLRRDLPAQQGVPRARSGTEPVGIVGADRGGDHGRSPAHSSSSASSSIEV